LFKTFSANKKTHHDIFRLIEKLHDGLMVAPPTKNDPFGSFFTLILRTKSKRRYFHIILYQDVPAHFLFAFLCSNFRRHGAFLENLTHCP
jgi:hypothetical protein